MAGLNECNFKLADLEGGLKWTWSQMNVVSS